MAIRVRESCSQGFEGRSLHSFPLIYVGNVMRLDFPVLHHTLDQGFNGVRCIRIKFVRPAITKVTIIFNLDEF